MPPNQLDAQCYHYGQCANGNQCPKVRICYKSKTFDIYFHSFSCWKIFVCKPIVSKFNFQACICNNILPKAKVVLCLWHAYKAWAENAVKKIASVERRSRVLSALGSIMYSRDCPLHAKPILWAKQLGKLAPNYINLTHFCEYLNQHWLPKARMWCIGNQNIPHARQDINAIVESFHINMKRTLYSFQERLIGCKMD
jgi:hypothetical protein